MGENIYIYMYRESDIFFIRVILFCRIDYYFIVYRGFVLNEVFFVIFLIIYRMINVYDIDIISI